MVEASIDSQKNKLGLKLEKDKFYCIVGKKIELKAKNQNEAFQL